MEEMTGLKETAELTDELAEDYDPNDEGDVAALDALNDHAENLIDVIEAPIEE